MAAKSTSIGGELLSDYSVCHNNWQYPWLRPTEAEFLEAWEKLYAGVEPPIEPANDVEYSDDEDDTDNECEAEAEEMAEDEE